MTRLDKPLLGHRGRLTRVAILYLAFVTAIVLVNVTMSYSQTSDARLWLALPLDLLGWLATVSVASTVVVGVGIAWWNGGTALAPALPLAPGLIGSMIRGHATPHPDIGLLAGAATFAAWLACYRTYRDNLEAPHLDLSIGIAVATTVFALSLLRTVARTAGAHATSGLVGATALFLVGIAIPGWWLIERAQE